jgi:hypothetical protein
VFWILEVIVYSFLLYILYFLGKLKPAAEVLNPLQADWRSEKPLLVRSCQLGLAGGE